MPDEGRPDGFPSGVGIEMGPAHWLRNDFVNHLESNQVLGRELERVGRALPLSRILPEDRGASFGEITEYTEFSSISTRSATPRASAPPEPPSPITRAMQGVGRAAISMMFRASASDCPRSSAPSPG